jgi:hypothetical protein
MHRSGGVRQRRSSAAPVVNRRRSFDAIREAIPRAAVAGIAFRVGILVPVVLIVGAAGRIELLVGVLLLKRHAPPQSVNQL